MIKRGIILAGGMGTRMSPLTKAVNKQLLPIYDKPLIFYPLSILMLANIKDILIIVNKGQLDQYKKILPDGNNLGIKISYEEQDKPRGLPDAFIIGENFIKNQNVALILGDNFFYGQNLTKNLIHNSKLNSKNKIITIKEKPKKFISNYAITGLYFFDKNVVKYSKKLKPSKRGELEITDLLNFYRNKNQLSADFLGRGGAWLDTGTMDDYYKTISFVSAIENRQGLKIACLEEISLNKKWIKKNNIIKAIKFYGNCDYSKYLLKLI